MILDNISNEYTRDPKTGALISLNKAEFLKRKKEKNDARRIGKLEEDVKDMNRKIDLILELVSKS